ncbi:probable rRNA maturation factor [Pontibaca methylaminivorans]|uniref:Endoribonuclease YbeY n=2 Tax=Pontibaca methylaminivorans TaxID=515897 RepID=A0A1R3WZN9_9RHOB|nr:probable rRNA maturation factor [Pontibaca methylaminivorans]
MIEDSRWTATGLTTLAARAGDAALVHLGLDPARFGIALLGCDDARIAALNAAFRGQEQATNVLSWPLRDRAPEREGARPALPGAEECELGDIALAFDTCTAEARAAGRALSDHVTHLVVHGVLHLLGYDHLRDGDAELMERLEREILGTLGIDDPYE